MPEGPELHLSSLFINRICKNRLFSGQVYRNPIHKCAEVSWNQPVYSIAAESRGKELMLHLSSCSDNLKFKHHGRTSNKSNGQSRLSIRLTFGMSGKFEFTPANELFKHSHLSFFTKDEPKMALSFVDARRFGKWVEVDQWSEDRGPCVIQEYESFVDNIFDNVNHSAFQKPICEVLLNQRFFSGIGNYLRAEILYRCGVPPFERASTVLQLENEEDAVKNTEAAADVDGDIKPSVKQKKRSSKKGAGDEVKPKMEVLEQNGGEETTSTYFAKSNSSAPEVKLEAGVNQSANSSSDETGNTCKINLFKPKAREFLQLCNTIPIEVVKLGSTKYALSDLYKDTDDGQSFYDWVQCYCQPGMKNLTDHNSRTIWFSGPAGPLVPKDQKSRGVKKSKKSAKVVKEEKEETIKTELDTAESPPTEQVLQKETITRKRLQKTRAREATSGKKGKRSAKTEVDTTDPHSEQTYQKETVTVTRKRLKEATATRESGRGKKAKLETTAVVSLSTDKKQQDRKATKTRGPQRTKSRKSR